MTKKKNPNILGGINLINSIDLCPSFYKVVNEEAELVKKYDIDVETLSEPSVFIKEEFLTTDSTSIPGAAPIYKISIEKNRAYYLRDFIKPEYIGVNFKWAILDEEERETSTHNYKDLNDYVKYFAEKEVDKKKDKSLKEKPAYFITGGLIFINNFDFTLLIEATDSKVFVDETSKIKYEKFVQKFFKFTIAEKEAEETTTEETKTGESTTETKNVDNTESSEEVSGN